MPHSTSRRCIHSGDRGGRVEAGHRAQHEPVAAASGRRPRRDGRLPSIGSGSTAAGSRNGDAVRGGGLAGDAADRQAVAAVRRDGDVEHLVAQAEQLDGVGADARARRSSTRMPVWSSPMPSSRDEQIIPSLTWPYVLRAVMAKPPGQRRARQRDHDPVADGEVRAPQTMPARLGPRRRRPGTSGSSCRWRRSPPRTRATRPTTSGPVMSWPGCSTVSTSRPGGDQPLGRARGR